MFLTLFIYIFLTSNMYYISVHVLIVLLYELSLLWHCIGISWIPVYFLVGGLEHCLFSISYLGCNPSRWRTHIFQDGYCTTNQISIICPYIYIFIYPYPLLWWSKIYPMMIINFLLTIWGWWSSWSKFSINQHCLKY